MHIHRNILSMSPPVYKPFHPLVFDVYASIISDADIRYRYHLKSHEYIFLSNDESQMNVLHYYTNNHILFI